MARADAIRVLRTTRANLDSQAAANGLLVGEPYLITDEARLAVGTAVDTYEATAKASEADAALKPADLSNATPADLGTAASGTAGTVSRADHVHDMPSASDVGALSATAPVLAGDLDAAGSRLDDYAETSYTLPTTSGSYTLNLANGMVQSVTLTGALTLTMPTAPSTGVTRSFVLEVDCAGSALSWAASPAIQWVGGAAPSLETGAGAFNELTFRYSHLASAWVGRLTASEAA